MNLKKSFFLYPTANGDIVLSGYPSWVRHSDIYPFRIYTFLLDERSSKLIGETSVSINTVNLLSDESECGSQETSGLFTGTPPRTTHTQFHAMAAITPVRGCCNIP